MLDVAVPKSVIDIFIWYTFFRIDFNFFSLIYFCWVITIYTIPLVSCREINQMSNPVDHQLPTLTLRTLACLTPYVLPQGSAWYSGPTPDSGSPALRNSPQMGSGFHAASHASEIYIFSVNSIFLICLRFLFKFLLL